MIAFTVLVAMSVIFYFYAKFSHRYWKVRGVSCDEPNLFLGNAGDLLLGKKSMLDSQCEIHDKIGDKKFFGVFMFLKPVLYINDLSIIKHILLKDFAIFQDRGLNFGKQLEPLTMHLFHLEGKEWSFLRNKVTPSFSENAINLMFPFMVDCAKRLNAVFKKYSEEDDIEIKDIMTRYSSDVIGSCAFGIKSDALENVNSEFHKISKKIFAPRMRTILKLVLPNLPSFLVRWFDLKMVPTEVSNYFRMVIRQQLEARKNGLQRRNDFLDLLIDLKMKMESERKPDKNNVVEFTPDIIAAQCFLFFIAGYENTSSILCFCLYELSRDMQVQNRLKKEIYSVLDGNLDNISYNNLIAMNYLDQVVSEVVRRWPPASSLIRNCSEDYNLPGTNLVLEKGMQVIVPLCGIHRDQKYYANPEIFDPEHFSEDAKKGRDRFSYMPFGDGPRKCIGRKIGLIQVKLALASILLDYEFLPSPLMKDPIQLEGRTFIASMKGGTWLRCIEKSY